MAIRVISVVDEAGETSAKSQPKFLLNVSLDAHGVRASQPRIAQTPAAFLGTPGLQSIAPSAQTAHEGSRRVRSTHGDQGIFPLSMKLGNHQQNPNRSSFLMYLLMPTASEHPSRGLPKRQRRWATLGQVESTMYSNGVREHTAGESNPSHDSPSPLEKNSCAAYRG